MSERVEDAFREGPEETAAYPDIPDMIQIIAEEMDWQIRRKSEIMIRADLTLPRSPTLQATSNLNSSPKSGTIYFLQSGSSGHLIMFIDYPSIGALYAGRIPAGEWSLCG